LKGGGGGEGDGGSGEGDVWDHCRETKLKKLFTFVVQLSLNLNKRGNLRLK
jgi:hypothetical protein